MERWMGGMDNLDIMEGEIDHRWVSRERDGRDGLERWMNNLDIMEGEMDWRDRGTNE